MHPTIRTALPVDLATVCHLMRGYYRDDGLELTQMQQDAMQRLVREPQWGRVYLLEVNSQPVGYVAVCFGFSVELGGNDAFVDEAFVLPEHRGRGYGTQLLDFAANDCATLGVRALHLEVDQRNTRARQLYASLATASGIVTTT